MKNTRRYRTDDRCTFHVYAARSAFRSTKTYAYKHRVHLSPSAKIYKHLSFEACGKNHLRSDQRPLIFQLRRYAKRARAFTVLP